MNRHRMALAALVLAAVALVLAESRLFVVPASAAPGRVDAVVVLGGADRTARWARAVELVRAHPGVPVLLSSGSPYDCRPAPPGATRIVCFRPVPFTTQGEARYVAEYARARRWRSVAVVTTPDQTWRAGVRFERCWSGDVRMVAARSSIVSRLEMLPYQNAASVKAVVLQRDC